LTGVGAAGMLSDVADEGSEHPGRGGVHGSAADRRKGRLSDREALEALDQEVRHALDRLTRWSAPRAPIEQLVDSAITLLNRGLEASARALRPADAERDDEPPRIWVDFQKPHEGGGIKLSTIGSRRDLGLLGADLREGMDVLFYDDATGDETEIVVEGVVHFDEENRCWFGDIDPEAIRLRPRPKNRGH
jgi:hypothetical protein